MPISSSNKEKQVLATNAASSGIKLDKKIMKKFAKRSDVPGILFLIKLFLVLMLLGFFVYESIGTLWLIPAELLYGTVLTVSMYSLSHEAAHGTAFKSRWVNEVAFWISSLIYMEEPLHRRYTHTNHHTFTWHVGKDTQMPFDTPMNFRSWVLEISGLALLKFHIGVMKNLVLKKYTEQMRLAVPAENFQN
jgi:Fatty acid desaturase